MRDMARDDGIDRQRLPSPLVLRAIALFVCGAWRGERRHDRLRHARAIIPFQFAVTTALI
jgi:hypothetical protein